MVWNQSLIVLAHASIVFPGAKEAMEEENWRVGGFGIPSRMEVVCEFQWR